MTIPVSSVVFNYKQPQTFVFLTGTANHDKQGIAEQNAKKYNVGVRLFPAKFRFTVTMWNKISF